MPYDRARTTPFDVSAAQLDRSPGFDEHVTVEVVTCDGAAFWLVGESSCVSCPAAGAVRKTRSRRIVVAPRLAPARVAASRVGMSGMIGELISRAHSTPGATDAIFGGSRHKSLRTNRSSAAWSGIWTRGTSAIPEHLRYDGARIRRSPHPCRRQQDMMLGQSLSLAHDVRLAVMPFAALLNVATAKGLPAHRHAATVSETKKLHVIAVNARGAPPNLNEREQVHHVKQK